MKEVGKLGSGEAVFDRFNSHTHNGVMRLLPAALAEIDSQGRKFFIHEHDFGRVVGETVCVVTGRDDQIVYAKRPKRFGHSRFVKNRNPEPCSKIVIILKRDGHEDYYVLVTAFVGHRSEPEPWDRNATPRSRDFWATHALVWGAEETISGTETTVCSW